MVSQMGRKKKGAKSVDRGVIYCEFAPQANSSGNKKGKGKGPIYHSVKREKFSPLKEV